MLDFDSSNLACTVSVCIAEYMHAEFGIAILQAGTVDTLIDQLPGFPDGISRASAEDGSFWVGRVC
jgi:hypothetical protein